MKTDTHALLEEFRNNCCAWQSRSKAKRILSLLKSVLTDSEYHELSIAHKHYEIGEGPGECYDIIKKLKNKYR